MLPENLRKIFLLIWNDLRTTVFSPILKKLHDHLRILVSSRQNRPDEARPWDKSLDFCLRKIAKIAIFIIMKIYEINFHN